MSSSAFFSVTSLAKVLEPFANKLYKNNKGLFCIFEYIILKILIF